jgi:hypothetical protein
MAFVSQVTNSVKVQTTDNPIKVGEDRPVEIWGIEVSSYRTKCQDENANCAR